MTDLSVIIPARNEEFLSNTIDDILKNRRADTEVIVVLDGYWPVEPIKQNRRVNIIHHEESIGQRAATNEGAKLSSAKFIMKLDAHCALDEGFDEKLMADCEYDWTVIPAMYNLHVFDWVCPKCKKKYYQSNKPDKCEKCRTNSDGFTKDILWRVKSNPRSEFYYFDSIDLRFKYWREFKKRSEAKPDLAPTLGNLGACFMMHRERFFDLGGLDEKHGSWGQFGTEIAAKTLTSGGKQLTNKKTWFAHLFRTGKGLSFPYEISGKQVRNARKYSNRTWRKNEWSKQIYPLSKIIEDFMPVPTWEDIDFVELKMKEMESANRAGIYSIINLENGKIYIGSTINLSRRLYEHIKMLEGNRHENDHLQKSWNKYGRKSFSFEILKFCDEYDNIEYEQLYIDYFREEIGWRRMFNCDPKAGSRLGAKHSEETKQKMRENNSRHFLGKEHTKESRRKMSESSKGQVAWNKGEKWNDDVKKKIGDANRGRKLSEEAKRKIKESMKHRDFSSKKMRDIALNSSRFSGKNHTDESKKKISEGVKESVKNRKRDKNGRFISSDKPSNKPYNRHKSKGLVYYTDNQCQERILAAARAQLDRSKDGHELISISQYPIDFGKNIVLEIERSVLSMFIQILRGIEECSADIIFLVEHDILYNESHFDFTPSKKDVYYYNDNVWKVDASDGKALYHDKTKQVSGLVAHKSLLLDHYVRRVKHIKKHGWKRKMGYEPGKKMRHGGLDDFKYKYFTSKYPIIDIKHPNTLTRGRFKLDEYRCKNQIKDSWRLEDGVPHWGETKNRFDDFLRDVIDGKIAVG